MITFNFLIIFLFLCWHLENDEHLEDQLLLYELHQLQPSAGQLEEDSPNPQLAAFLLLTTELRRESLADLRNIFANFLDPLPCLLILFQVFVRNRAERAPE